MPIITWNPSDKGASITLSNNNLTATGFTTANHLVRATEGKTSGKWYFEYVVSGSGAESRLWVGFANQTFTNYSLANNFIRAIEPMYGHIWTQGGGVNNYQSGLVNNIYGKVIGFALDLDAKVFDVYVDNVKLNITTTVGGKNIRDISDFGSNVIFPIAYTIGTTQNNVSAKFNLRDFTYTPPTGFLPYGDSPTSVKYLIQDKNNILFSGVANLNNLVTKMTSNSGEVLASTEYNATYQAWKAFNGANSVESDAWITLTGTTTGWLRYKFNTPTIVNKYAVSNENYASTSPTSAPKNWTFEGSNDGTTWTILDTRTNETGWSNAQRREYNFNNFTQYLYYRINVSANNGYASWLAIGELELMNTLLILDKLNTTTLADTLFINKGMADPTVVNGQSPITRGIYGKDNGTLGTGKLFEFNLDSVFKSVKEIK